MGGELLLVLKRAWYVGLLGVCAIGGLSFALLHFAVPTTHEAKALLLLLPPKTSQGIQGNPFLGLDSVGSAAGVLARAMSSDAKITAVQDAHPNATFTVDKDTSTSGPVLVVTVQDIAAKDTMAALTEIVTDAPSTLNEMQSRTAADAKSYITVTVLAQDLRPTPSHKAQVRALLALVGGLGGALVMAMLLWSRHIERRRIRRRSARPSASKHAPNTPSPPSEGGGADDDQLEEQPRDEPVGDAEDQSPAQVSEPVPVARRQSRSLPGRTWVTTTRTNNARPADSPS